MAKTMGYPLPTGEAYTDEFACMMLFYPDKSEYRQALFGALDYMGTWLAWERNTSKTGKDAARAWSEAIALTRECIEMNMCETLIELLTEIRDNTGVYCCEPGDISNGDRYTDAVEDGVGNVPQNIIDAGYASGTSDWAGFDDYKCMISHVMITNMEWQCRKFSQYADEAGAIIGVAAAAAAIAAVILTGGGAVLIFGMVVAVAGVAGLYSAISEVGEAGLTSLADDVEDNHDALACAVYNSDGSADAVANLKDEIDSLFGTTDAIILKNLNLDAQLKALYAGRYDAQDIAEKMDDEGYDLGDYDCSCPAAEYSYLAVFLADKEYWDTALIYGYHTSGNPSGSLFAYYSEPYARISNGALRSGAGIGGSTSIEIVKVTLDYLRPTSTQSSTCRVTFAPAGINEDVDITGLSAGSWHTGLEFTPTGTAVVAYNAWAVYLDNLVATTGGGHWDNVRVWFNVL